MTMAVGLENNQQKQTLPQVQIKKIYIIKHVFKFLSTLIKSMKKLEKSLFEFSFWLCNVSSLHTLYATSTRTI